MILLTLFSFLAGLVTVLSPCIFPILPVLLAGAVGKGKARPLGIIAGFIISFTVVTLTLSSLVQWTGIPANALRIFAIVILAVFGLFLLIPRLQLFFEWFISKVLPQAQSQSRGSGFWSGYAVGTSLGLIWTPCVGPIMAAVMTLAASNEVSTYAVVVTLAYSLGTAVPMLGVMIGGRGLMDRMPWFKQNGANIQKAFGALMIVLALVLWQGYDKKFEAWFLDQVPDYASRLTSLEKIDPIKKALGELI